MPGEVPAKTTLTSGSSRALVTCAVSHTLPPTQDLRPPGTRAGLQVHIPVPPAIMPTDFTVLMTGSDFLSGRMANFPGESKGVRSSSQTHHAWGSDRMRPCPHLKGLGVATIISPPASQVRGMGRGDRTSSNAKRSRRLEKQGIPAQPSPGLFPA